MFWTWKVNNFTSEKNWVQISKNAVFSDQSENLKQASKQERIVGCFLEI
jgi:hypothetical protein